ncbi:hypothetical protein BB560_004295, partial [Smittium megazygosporum]
LHIAANRPLLHTQSPLAGFVSKTNMPASKVATLTCLFNAISLFSYYLHLLATSCPINSTIFIYVATMTILPKTPSSIPLNKNSPTDSSSSKNNNPGPANDLSSSVPSLRAKSSLSNPSSKLSASIKKTSNQVSQPSVQNYSSKSHPSSKNYNKPFDPSSSKIRPPKIRKLPNNHTPNTTTSRPASRQASSAPKNIYARSTSRNQRRVLSPNPNSAQPASSINSSPQHRINSAAS